MQEAMITLHMTYASSHEDAVATGPACASDTDTCSTPGRPSTPVSVNRDALYDADEQEALAKLSQAVATGMQSIAGLQREVRMLCVPHCIHVSDPAASAHACRTYPADTRQTVTRAVAPHSKRVVDQT